MEDYEGWYLKGCGFGIEGYVWGDGFGCGSELGASVGNGSGSGGRGGDGYGAGFDGIGGTGHSRSVREYREDV